CDHPDLHPFPTRRSSDLVPAEAGFDLDEESIVRRAMAVGGTDNPLTNFFWWIGHIGRTTELGPEGSLDPDALETVLEALDVGIRSEEHTSELQSRENLVC